MADKRSSRKTDSEKGQLDISFKGNNEEEQPERARYSYIPISYYWLKDVVKEFVARENFPDAMAVVFASLSVSVAFPFYPLIILIPILVATDTLKDANTTAMASGKFSRATNSFTTSLSQ